MSSTHISPLGSYKGASSPLDRRGWTVALAFQEVFTAIVRLRFNRQNVSSAEAFRSQMLQALAAAEQEARSRGCSVEDLQEVKFALIAFLDETALGSRNPAFTDWNRLPVQAQLYGHLQGGEVFFQQLQKSLNRSDSRETADLLEVYYLCLLLGFKGRYAAGGDLPAIMNMVREKIARIRGRSAALSPRGALPADAVRLVETDHWLKPLTIACVSIIVLAAAIFGVFKIVLVSGASELSNLATQFAK
jgi:type VI secretion system protein ImpK